MESLAVHHRKVERFMLLYSVYKKSMSSTDYVIDMKEVSYQEGIGYKPFKSAFDYLCNEGLLRPRVLNESNESFYYAAITNEGINAIEDVFREDIKESRYFPAYRKMMQ
jgi:hypothetical protein